MQNRFSYLFKSAKVLMKILTKQFAVITLLKPVLKANRFLKSK